MAKEEVSLLEGMPPAKKMKARNKARKRFVPTRGIPVEVSVRRQVAEEIGEAEPTRDQKYVLLQKYGVVDTVIDRRVSKPNWMGVVEWKKKLNEWFKATKGLVPARQEKKFNRPGQQKPFPPKHRPWRELKSQAGRRPDTNRFHQNSGRGRTGSLPN